MGRKFIVFIRMNDSAISHTIRGFLNMPINVQCKINLSILMDDTAELLRVGFQIFSRNKVFFLCSGANVFTLLTIYLCCMSLFDIKVHTSCRSNVNCWVRLFRRVFMLAHSEFSTITAFLHNVSPIPEYNHLKMQFVAYFFFAAVVVLFPFLK